MPALYAATKKSLNAPAPSPSATGRPLAPSALRSRHSHVEQPVLDRRQAINRLDACLHPAAEVGGDTHPIAAPLERGHRRLRIGAAVERDVRPSSCASASMPARFAASAGMMTSGGLPGAFSPLANSKILRRVASSGARFSTRYARIC